MGGKVTITTIHQNFIRLRRAVFLLKKKNTQTMKQDRSLIVLCF